MKDVINLTVAVILTWVFVVCFSALVINIGWNYGFAPLLNLNTMSYVQALVITCVLHVVGSAFRNNSVGNK